ncbi:unnamed protein product [Linum tenue]|uniref:Uncharacterized protein n=1 Tax=Linum tenue TaxID=586396 RepID=A0AAV0QTE1_9ROSI|nr:unnamed protein product [Linum tenue]
MEGVLESVGGGGLRKGAWTEDEDRLLRRCIEAYGEGRWHQVPIRAGLNRCRKSCRLRWLNYLKPNIKRGEFSDDEVDLITRLHNLLGNRWSLIAGRLPGRTANDVKNYWNTHQKKKTTPFPCKTGCISNGRQPSAVAKKNNKNNNIPRLQITKTNIIKPRPRTFSPKTFCWPKKPTEPKKPNSNNYELSPPSRDDDHSRYDDQENHAGAGITWVDQLESFLDDGIGSRPVTESGVLETDQIPLAQLMSSILPDHSEKSAIDLTAFQEDNYQSLWSDVDIWHLLGDHHDI